MVRTLVLKIASTLIFMVEVSWGKEAGLVRGRS